MKIDDEFVQKTIKYFVECSELKTTLNYITSVSVIGITNIGNGIEEMISSIFEKKEFYDLLSRINVGHSNYSKIKRAYEYFERINDKKMIRVLDFCVLIAHGVSFVDDHTIDLTDTIFKNTNLNLHNDKNNTEPPFKIRKCCDLGFFDFDFSENFPNWLPCEAHQLSFSNSSVKSINGLSEIIKKCERLDFPILSRDKVSTRSVLSGNLLSLFKIEGLNEVELVKEILYEVPCYNRSDENVEFEKENKKNFEAISNAFVLLNKYLPTKDIFEFQTEMIMNNLEHLIT